MTLLILYLISVVGCFVALSHLLYTDRSFLTVRMLLHSFGLSLIPIFNFFMFIGLIGVGLVNYVSLKYDDFFSKVVIEKKD